MITAEGEFHFPAPRVDVVDTTGAGDAFVGGLLFTLSRANCWNHALLAEAISNANACGAMAVTAKGAMTALPFPDQLNTFFPAIRWHKP
ncbi:aminoimidazole riboside kinase [Salmonella enterica subsp. enterica]|uniref:Aminoimidazole riboside kinase n=1 Tax=Salmonella enterica I TaxID=59201 RepID=A0A379WHC2_SALET|nr:aminoimidazole riboside kinase [Salmonella enterica subsp. enterica]